MIAGGIVSRGFVYAGVGAVDRGAKLRIRADLECLQSEGVPVGHDQSGCPLLAQPLLLRRDRTAADDHPDCHGGVAPLHRRRNGRIPGEYRGHGRAPALEATAGGEAMCSLGSLRALAWALCCAVGGAAAAAPSEIVWKDLSGWEVEYGRWRAEEGTLLQTEVGPARTIIWRPGKAYSDLDLTIPFKASSEGDGVKAAGVVYRAVSQEEYYYIHYDVRNSQVVWVRSAPGKEWTDARRHRWPELRAETWHTTRGVVRGDRHEVYLDGKRLFTETDGTLQAGVIGLRTGQGRIAFGTARLEGTEVSLDRPFVVLKPPFSDLCTDAGTGGYEAFPDVCRTKSGELLCVFYAGHIT